MHMQNYTFDESIIPSMPIPDMTAPPPLPPKRRTIKKPVRNKREGEGERERDKEKEKEREKERERERERESENKGTGKVLT